MPTQKKEKIKKKIPLELRDIDLSKVLASDLAYLKEFDQGNQNKYTFNMQSLYSSKFITSLKKELGSSLIFNNLHLVGLNFLLGVLLRGDDAITDSEQWLGFS